MVLNKDINMPPKMTEQEVNALRYHILRMCNTANGMTAPEILEEESIKGLTEKYARVTIMSMVQALTKTGLLTHSGITRGNLYFTTPEGQEAEKRYKAGME